MRPMLAVIGDKEDLKRKGWIFEPKFDGFRALIFQSGKQIRLLSRNGLWLHDKFPGLKEIYKSIVVKSCILDGEIIVLDENGRPDFHALLRNEGMPMIIAFDILEVEGKNLESLHLIARKKILEHTLKDSELIAKCTYSHDGKKAFAAAKKLGMEGVVAKEIDSPYVQRRSNYWIKVKILNTIDCIIVGFTEGAPGRSFGSLLTACYYKGKLTYIGNVGTGMSDKFLAELKENLKKIATRNIPPVNPPKSPRKITWVKPQIVAEVEYLELTRDFRLRAPVFKRLRADKKPEECVLEISS